MLLGGMGPVGEIQSDAGKIFASVYALYAGLVFITVTALLLGPVLHRLMHKFHATEPPKKRQR
jgi:fumarate reductase subunit D